MDAVRPPNASPPAAPPAAAWPYPVQLAAAFLLGAACALLGVRLVGSTSARPLDLASTPAIDLNRAEVSELRQLPGIGPALADRIAERRDAAGGFRNVDDLRTVPGVGPARLERLRPWVRVTGSQPAEGDESMSPPATKPAPPSARAKKAESLSSPIDVNRATADELQKLPGIGAKMAQRILDERAKRPFRSLEELRRVSGIGPKTLEKLRPFVTVGDEPSASAPN